MIALQQQRADDMGFPRDCEHEHPEKWVPLSLKRESREPLRCNRCKEDLFQSQGNAMHYSAWRLDLPKKNMRTDGWRPVRPAIFQEEANLADPSSPFTSDTLLRADVYEQC